MVNIWASQFVMPFLPKVQRWRFRAFKSWPVKTSQNHNNFYATMPLNIDKLPIK